MPAYSQLFGIRGSWHCRQLDTAANGARRSTGDTQKMGESAGTAQLVNPWPMLLTGTPLELPWP